MVKEVPLSAIVFTSVVSSLLACINIGSTTAMNQIFPLGVVGLLSSYLVSTGYIALKRRRGEKLLDAHFRFGNRAGLLVDVVAIIFTMLALVMAFFPPVRGPPPSVM